MNAHAHILPASRDVDLFQGAVAAALRTGEAGVAVGNVNHVKALSPFRYPGGKTWLVPHVRTWLATRDVGVLLEPFAGGGSVSLSAIASGWVDRAVMVELDDDVAAVWGTLLGPDDAGFDRLRAEVLGFVPDRDAVLERLALPEDGLSDRAFRTILRNRMNRGGILAKGASLLKAGEKNRGLASRWYPETLARRFDLVREMRCRIEFVHGDAFEAISRFSDDPRAAFFVDPPYTAGGSRAGKRLYVHSVIDHAGLFSACAAARGPVMMTYDDAPEVVQLSRSHGLEVSRIPMRSAHQVLKRELVISKG